jgi:hypothetical protein
MPKGWTTRAEHLALHKRICLEYCDAGEPRLAVESFLIRLGEHPLTAGHHRIDIAVALMSLGRLVTSEEVHEFIKGFN